MSSVENIFDINTILKKSFISLKQVNHGKKIELIFDMHPTIPRELKGNDVAIKKLLLKVLGFVYENTQENEIVLSLNAPEDFLYEEHISFKIRDTGISKEKILAFWETGLGNTLKMLEGEIVYDENDIHLSIPFVIGELGFRRHYRLPSKSMLQKKVLLIVKSENVTSSITKMFKYFPYDVDFGFKAFQNNSMNLLDYDVVVMEDNLLTESFKTNIKEAQKNKKIKFVLLGEEGLDGCGSVCGCLVKPITQESIFELIISLFNENSKVVKKMQTQESIQINKPLQPLNDKDIPIMHNKTENNTLHTIIESKRAMHVEVLDIRKGLDNTQAMGVLYSDELEKFLDVFECSDLYFRQIVNEKAENKIKEFCIDLEKHAKIIGAESMLKFADIVSLLFVYDKLDMLPIYPGRYHIELDKLVTAIKKYLYL
jgi:hypothetical protein